MNSFMDTFYMWDSLASCTNNIGRTSEHLKSVLYEMINEYEVYQEETEMQDMLIAWSSEIFDKTKLKNISLNHLTTVTFESANRCYELELVNKKPCLSWSANKKSKYHKATDEYGAISFNSNYDCYHWIMNRYKKRG